MLCLILLSLGVVISGYDKKLFTSIICLIVLSGIGLSGFHIGVEQKWWAMPKSCISNVHFSESDPIDILKSLDVQMKGKKNARCDKVDWYLFGLPASWWTFLAFTFATTIMVFREWKIKKK